MHLVITMSVGVLDMKSSLQPACGPQPTRGFTLIEIMIAVAVIGILAALAFPAYSDYQIRARVSEGLFLAAAAKVAVADAPRSLAELTDAANAFNAQPQRSKYVRSMAINNATGAITVTLDEANIGGLTAASNTVTLSPFIPTGPGAAVTLVDAMAAGNLGAISWACASQRADVAAQRGMVPAVLGTLPARYAPLECR
jgi:type IV pilus assembly protein PilA